MQRNVQMTFSSDRGNLENIFNQPSTVSPIPVIATQDSAGGAETGHQAEPSIQLSMTSVSKA